MARHPAVAFVVDDIVSLNPWQVRCLEIRGRAEALSDQPPPRPGFGREIIRIHPQRIFTFGIDPAEPGMRRRSITPATGYTSFAARNPGRATSP